MGVITVVVNNTHSLINNGLEDDLLNIALNC